MVSLYPSDPQKAIQVRQRLINAAWRRWWVSWRHWSSGPRFAPPATPTRFAVPATPSWSSRESTCSSRQEEERAAALPFVLVPVPVHLAAPVKQLLQHTWQE